MDRTETFTLANTPGGNGGHGAENALVYDPRKEEFRVYRATDEGGSVHSLSRSGATYTTTFQIPAYASVWEGIGSYNSRYKGKKIGNVEMPAEERFLYGLYAHIYVPSASDEGLVYLWVRFFDDSPGHYVWAEYLIACELGALLTLLRKLDMYRPSKAAGWLPALMGELGYKARTEERAFRKPFLHLEAPTQKVLTIWETEENLNPRLEPWKFAPWIKEFTKTPLTWQNSRIYVLGDDGELHYNGHTAFDAWDKVLLLDRTIEEKSHLHYVDGLTAWLTAANLVLVAHYNKATGYDGDRAAEDVSEADCHVFDMSSDIPEYVGTLESLRIKQSEASYSGNAARTRVYSQWNMYEFKGKYGIHLTFSCTKKYIETAAYGIGLALSRKTFESEADLWKRGRKALGTHHRDMLKSLKASAPVPVETASEPSPHPEVIWEEGMPAQELILLAVIKIAELPDESLLGPVWRSLIEEDEPGALAFWDTFGWAQSTKGEIINAGKNIFASCLSDKTWGEDLCLTLMGACRQQKEGAANENTIP